MYVVDPYLMPIQTSQLDRPALFRSCSVLFVIVA